MPQRETNEQESDELRISSDQVLIEIWLDRLKNSTRRACKTARLVRSIDELIRFPVRYSL